MRILVVFGSKSDANIYDPLNSRLQSDGHEIDFRMISVHRSPELLDRELQGVRVDAVVAGAGLAAHLPGVLASKQLAPVFGIPCAAALGGVDSLLGIMQMPFGIPVLCSAPDQFLAVTDFLKRQEQMELRFSTAPINLVVDPAKRVLPHFEDLLQRGTRVAEKANLELNIVDRPLPDAINVCLVDISARDPEAPLAYPEMQKNEQQLRIHVPILNPSLYRDAKSTELVVRRILSARGALWTGVNGVGNGLLTAVQLSNSDGRHSAFLTNAKKGYVHG
jgi:5-(carboxyamino)imidazole ribonucleotide mutase